MAEIILKVDPLHDSSYFSISVTNHTGLRISWRNNGIYTNYNDNNNQTNTYIPSATVTPGGEIAIDATFAEEVRITNSAQEVISFGDFCEKFIIGAPANNLISVPNQLPPNLKRVVLSGSTTFNQDISGWGTSNLTDMSDMFRNSTNFNQDISAWNTSNVITMSGMFESSTSFNQPLNDWDVSNVRFMHSMFRNATSFNQPLNGWYTESIDAVNGMTQMFENATSFNQDLSRWCVSNIPSKPNNFDAGATSWTLPKPVWGTCPPPINPMFVGTNPVLKVYLGADDITDIYLGAIKL